MMQRQGLNDCFANIQCSSFESGDTGGEGGGGRCRLDEVARSGEVRLDRVFRTVSG